LQACFFQCITILIIEFVAMTIDASIKVIMMTAYGELDMIKEATDLGALMHFTKPFDIDDMRAEVNRQLQGGSSSSRFAIGS